MASVKARAVAPKKPANPWDEIDGVHLQLSKREAQALHALVAATTYRKEIGAIYDALEDKIEGLTVHNPFVARASYGSIEIVEA